MAECLQRRAHINRSVTNSASIPDSNHQASNQTVDIINQTVDESLYVIINIK